MSQQSKIGKHKTTVKVENGNLSVTYHWTEIVKDDLASRTITFNNGGFETATTKTRINQTLNQYNIPFRVFQKDFGWYIVQDGKVIDFVNNKTYNW